MHNKHLDFEIKFYEGVISRRPDYVEALVPLAAAYTRLGKYRKGLQIDKRLSTICKDDPIVHYNLACSYALVGYKRKAVQMLKKAIRLGYRDFSHLEKDDDLKCLHSEPEFKEILEGKFRLKRKRK